MQEEIHRAPPTGKGFRVRVIGERWLKLIPAKRVN